MAEVVYTYLRPQKELGRPPEFQDHEAESICDFFPKSNLRNAYVKLDPYETEHQCSAEVAEAATNTESQTLVSHGVTHIEGGWPLGIDPTEIESKIKFTRKVERDEAYIEACRRLVDPVDDIIRENNALDLYSVYFTDTSAATAPQMAAGGAGAGAGQPAATASGVNASAASAPTASAATATLSILDGVGRASMRVKAVVTDPSPVTRAASSIAWQGDRRIAVAYTAPRGVAGALSASGAPGGTAAVAHIFDIAQPTIPEVDLYGPHPVCSVAYNHKDVHLLAGGSVNGVVQVWDVRKPGTAPSVSSDVEFSHRGPVTDCRWLMSKGGEVLSVSTDGRVLVWDIRNMGRPIEDETVVLQTRAADAGPRGVLGGLCLDYDPYVAGSSKYMVGTEQGVTLSCNRRGKTAGEKITASFAGHHGPVCSVMRNPGFPKMFATAGDWTIRVWTDDLRAPIITTPYSDAYVTYAVWHPVRPAVLLATRSDGVLEAWDFLQSHTAPVAKTSVSDLPLRMVKLQSDGRLAAVAAVDGSVSLVELSDALVEPTKDERGQAGPFAVMMEREVARDKLLAQRHKEGKLKAKAKPAMPTRDADSAVDEAALAELAENFLKAVRAQQ